MRRVIIFLLVFILLFALAACDYSTAYVEPSQSTPAIEAENMSAENTDMYIGNKSSKVFHDPLCCTLPIEKNRVYFSTRNEAIQDGYKPCGNCKP